MTEQLTSSDNIQVSVVIPTRNRKVLLLRALKSVIAQTYKNLQIIVVDDASTDGTGKAVAAFVAEHSGISLQYIRNESPLGAGGARNAGINLASGEFIAFLDDDDEWLPDKVALQEYFLRNNPDYAVVSCLHLHSYSIGSYKSRAKEEITFEDLLWGNVCGSFSFATVRRDKVMCVDGINSALTPCEDWDFWLKIISTGKIKMIQKHLVIYNDEEHDRISKRHRDMYVGYRNVYLRYARVFSPQCRRYHLKFLTHIRYQIAANRSGKLHSLLKEVRMGSPMFVLLDAADFFLPGYILRIAKKGINRFGFSIGRIFLKKAQIYDNR